MTRLNITYDLLQKAKLSSNIISLETQKIDENKNNYRNDEIIRCSNQIYFVICNSCYWCASYFGINDLESLSTSSPHVLDCQICNSHNTELIPISTDESFRVEYSATKGMKMEFYKSSNIVDRRQSS
jgi:hypothetical protein